MTHLTFCYHKISFATTQKNEFLGLHYATNSREIRCHYDDQMHIDTLKPPDVDDK